MWKWLLTEILGEDFSMPSSFDVENAIDTIDRYVVNDDNEMLLVWVKDTEYEFRQKQNYCV